MKNLIPILAILFILSGCKTEVSASYSSKDVSDVVTEQSVFGEFVIHKASGDTLVIVDTHDDYTDDPEHKYWVRNHMDYDIELIYRGELLFLDKNMSDIKTTSDYNRFRNR